MEKIKYNKFHKAMIKRVAQNIAQYVAKKNKLVAEIASMQTEVNHLQNMIASSEAPVRELTGYGVEDLVEKVVIVSDKLDKNGNIIKTPKFVLKYPETVVPPTENTETETETNAGEDTEITEPTDDNNDVEVLSATIEESDNNVEL